MRVLLAALLLLGSPALRADDDDKPPPPVEITERDFATWSKLRMANAMVDAWRLYRGTPEQQAKAAADRDQAFAAAGWSREKHDQTSSLLENAFVALQPDGDPEAAKELGPVTAATAKAHLAAIRENVSEKAEAQVRLEREQALAGTPPSASQLKGTWALDLDASVDSMAPGLDAKTKADIKAKIGEQLKGTTYVFGPGDSIESRSGGRTDKGTYRLEGGKLFFRVQGSKRERSMDIGIREGVLVVGSGMAKSAFRKQ